MGERIPEALQAKISRRLSFYQDIGIELFYRDRRAGDRPAALQPAPATQISEKETTLPKATRKPESLRFAAPKPALPKPDFLPRPPGLSLFDAASRIAGDSLPVIQAELVNCTRCKLHRGRSTVVFGDGNPQADLVFVGEGPGRDEDIQGLPFVGRAGKLLTQMIEAMGLQRKDVYICNVVKCRPPENRTPERDEVSTCSPFLLRQIDAIDPKVIVCLGSVAAQTLLETNRGITHYRGEWLEFRGRKLLATYHPAYLLRNPSAKGEVWKDLQKVMAVLGLQGRKGQPAAADKPVGRGQSS
jgi:uracil-DNA glycosylase